MTLLQPVRGTHDLLFDDCLRHRLLTERLRDVATASGFGEIATPILEYAGLFQRTLGETSDVVSKEMYTLADRGGEQLTLRPEGTAGVARAFISENLKDKLPLKFWYAGPMFRYERPQKGRQRQFHQVGIEYLGVASPWADVEVLHLGWQFLHSLGLTGSIALRLNTLGDAESRARYRDTLVAYLAHHEHDLSPDSRARLARNPLRVLDSKAPEDQAIVATAPRLADALTPAAQAFFMTVQEGLAVLGVPCTLDDRLVRGLDYYCHTAFEFVSDGLGAQATVLAGGRYDGLIGQLGGPETAAVGWAAGLERLALLMAAPVPVARPVAVIALDDSLLGAALALAAEVRAVIQPDKMKPVEVQPVEVLLGGAPGKRLKKAHKAGARLALILGPDEVAAGTVTVRDMDAGTQVTVAREGLGAWLRAHESGSQGLLQSVNCLLYR
jgi:histidyl-tRNA synthetase